MTSAETSPEREFAIDVVKRLRAASYEALWAGGCVRDELLGISPKDYDVATTATPQQVIELFGNRRTVPVGVSFGVVMVLGPTRACGQIEVATFRADGEYLDGRRPSEIKFCSAEEDARRRDFTINGMFFDPVTAEVIDYVNGRTDLVAKVVRAIGDPVARFTEDKLRMLRAVRFAATYNFQLEPNTADAVRTLRREISQVSVERIAQELRRMLSHSSRAISVRQLLEVGLFPELFPKLISPAVNFDRSFSQLLQRLSQLKLKRFEPALAAILCMLFADDLSDANLGIKEIGAHCRELRLSNEETQCVCWLVESAAACLDSERKPLHVVKPILHDRRITLLLDLLHAVESRRSDAEFLARFLESSNTELLNPTPFVDGRDLQQLGIEPGPEFKRILTLIRNEQLDEVITDRDNAIARIRQLADLL